MSRWFESAGGLARFALAVAADRLLISVGEVTLTCSPTLHIERLF